MGLSSPGWRRLQVMDIDELRVRQVWMYGRIRLQTCQQYAQRFAQSAGMRDANSPCRLRRVTMGSPRDDG